jgi:hypothetical protein
VSDHEIRIHYWPATPNLREFKFYSKGKEVFSCFVTFQELQDISRNLLDVLETMRSE